VNILELYTLDNQGEATTDQYLTMFRILGRLVEPVQEYFAGTAGYSFGNEAEAFRTGKEPEEVKAAERGKA
jgi:hypothetical protein